MATTSTTTRTRRTAGAAAMPGAAAPRTRKPRSAATASAVQRERTREDMIAEAAYFRAEQRGFVGGPAADLADWLEAEKEIDNRLANC